MPKILQLDAHVADLIAAGEVVERPASAVKELTENSIDAGAKSVTVEIQRGGMSYIRVTDDGCGIAPEDAETAFLRHATSKIRSEYDLESIGTLGFRGEALAAISAVSHIELMTRRPEDDFGTALLLDAGTLRTREETGCPVGTTMIVRDLFFNTPARLKFIKRDASEGAAVLAVVQHAAMSHPEVAFTFIREGKQELRTPGDGSLKSAMYAVLGRDAALGYTPVSSENEQISVEGFVTLPACCKGTRGSQFFFVNGRFVKSRTMTAALEEAYRNQKMVGKFPGCVLHITTRLNNVDVNVHPTKTEVKFVSEKQLFDAVYYGVLAALGENGTRVKLDLGDPAKSAVPAAESTPVAPAEEKAAPVIPPRRPGTYPGKENFYQTMTAAEYRAQAAAQRTAQPQILTVRDGTVPTYRTDHAPSSALRREPEPDDIPSVQEHVSLPETPPEPPKPPVPAPAPKAEPVPAPVPEPAAEPAPEPIAEMPEPEIPWRVVGELFNTYIIVEQGETAILIDKHAAHERMNFDRLKAQGFRPMAQQLLTPVVFRPNAEEGAALLAHLDLLEEFSFECEDFGDGSLIVRTIPADIAQNDVPATLSELAETLIVTGTADPDAAHDDMLHTIACKAAIKGGQRNGPEELLKVAEAVMADRVRYCPHGRPVAVELSLKQLEKQFHRT